MSAQRVATDPRISRRRRAIEKARRRKMAVWAGVATALGVAVWTVGWSPLLDVRDIRIKGARHVERAELLAAAGLPGEENLLFLSTEEVAARIESLPWVRSAKVGRRLPGTVRIEIVERKAALRVSGLTTDDWLVDTRGVILGPASGTEKVPVLTAPLLAPEAGERVDTSETRGALRVWRSLPRSLRKQVVALFAPTRERITLSLEAGTTVRYGAAERVDAKNGVLLALMRDVRSSGVAPTYIDIRVPTSPALGPPITTASVMTTPAAGEDFDGASQAAPGPAPTASPTP